ncbi:MAG: hypothetical protein ABIK89_07320, partial [Planctomycetota bacterium]
MKTFIKLLLFVFIVFAITAIARPQPACTQDEEKEPAKITAPQEEGKSAWGKSEIRTAAEAALDWLARHQNPEGYWDADGFPAQCTKDK